MEIGHIAQSMDAGVRPARAHYLDRVADHGSQSALQSLRDGGVGLLDLPTVVIGAHIFELQSDITHKDLAKKEMGTDPYRPYRPKTPMATQNKSATRMEATSEAR